MEHFSAFSIRRGFIRLGFPIKNLTVEDVVESGASVIKAIEASRTDKLKDARTVMHRVLLRAGRRRA